MYNDEKYTVIELLNFVRSQLDSIGEKHANAIPGNIEGKVADLLYDVKVDTTLFVYTIDALVQDIKNCSNKEIIARIKVIEKILTNLYETYYKDKIEQ